MLLFTPKKCINMQKNSRRKTGGWKAYGKSELFFLTLDVYAIYHAGIHEDSSLNTARWNVLYWNREEQNWKFIDNGYWNAANDNVTTRKFQPVTTQYMYFELLDANKAGTREANIYEIVCMNTSDLVLQISDK